MGNLEDKISMDNPIRFVDAFISFIYFEKEIFDLKTLKTQGRPSFQIEVFLKYTYMVISTALDVRKNYPKKIIETDFGTAFGTIGKSLRERERTSYDWALTNTVPMLGEEREMLCIHE